MPVTAPTIVTEITIPNTCTGGHFRASTTKHYGGNIYIAGVCDGSISGSDNDLEAVFYQMDILTETFTEIFSFQPSSFTAGALRQFDWPQRTWSSTFASNGNTTTPNSGYIQPFVNDFAFDEEGNLVIGMVNREVFTVDSDIELGYILRTYKDSDGNLILENGGTAGNYVSQANEIFNQFTWSSSF